MDACAVSANGAENIPEEQNIVGTELLRCKIIEALLEQGFQIENGQIVPPNIEDKDAVRGLHGAAVLNKRNKARRGLSRCEDRLLHQIARGRDLEPEKINPYLVEVESHSEDELLFRYACLHWSIPVSSGYGRRLRFLIRDRQNGKLMGLIGLGDPVFALKARDNWVEWGKEARQKRLQHVMDAFVLGAVPPYSGLLCGKLVALLVAANEVRRAFSRKYGQRESLIRHRQLDGQLALITTASALGRSSIYRRLRLPDRKLFISCGYTAGSGDFHFSNGVYSELIEFVREHCAPTAKNPAWGSGFRNRREVVRKGLKALGFSADWIYHGVPRELFVVPLAENARSFLGGRENHLDPVDLPADKLFGWFRTRWLLPRAERDQRWKEFDPKSWHLWKTER
jgi:hypothetical protein